MLILMNRRNLGRDGRYALPLRVGIAALAVALLSASEPAGIPPARSGPPAGRVVIGVRGDVSSFNLHTPTNALPQEVLHLPPPKPGEEQGDVRERPPSICPAPGPAPG